MTGGVGLADRLFSTSLQSVHQGCETIVNSRTSAAACGNDAATIFFAPLHGLSCLVVGRLGETLAIAFDSLVRGVDLGLGTTICQIARKESVLPLGAIGVVLLTSLIEFCVLLAASFGKIGILGAESDVGIVALRVSGIYLIERGALNFVDGADGSVMRRN